VVQSPIPSGSLGDKVPVPDTATGTIGLGPLRPAPPGLPDPSINPPTLAEAGDPFTAVRVIDLLARIERGRPVRIADVADRLNMSLPAMSRSLDKLVQLGFVDRVESEKDRRAKLVRLLPAGRAVLDEIEQARKSVVEEFTVTLSDDERAALHAALLPIVERIHTP